MYSSTEEFQRPGAAFSVDDAGSYTVVCHLHDDSWILKSHQHRNFPVLWDFSERPFDLMPTEPLAFDASILPNTYRGVRYDTRCNRLVAATVIFPGGVCATALGGAHKLYYWNKFWRSLKIASPEIGEHNVS